MTGLALTRKESSDESVVDAGEEHGLVQTVVGDAVAVGAGDAFDQAVQP
jgi:hypothetical protein